MRQFRKARKTNDDNSSPLTDSKGHSVGVVRLGVGAHLGSWVRKGGKSDGLTTSAPISDRCTMHSTCLFFFFLPHSTMPDRARKGILTITSTYLHSPSIGNSLGELAWPGSPWSSSGRKRPVRPSRQSSKCSSLQGEKHKIEGAERRMYGSEKLRRKRAC